MPNLAMNIPNETLMNAESTHPLQPFRFTKENSRQMAARSWEARRQRKAKLEAEAAQGRQSTPQTERLALQIERIEEMMGKTSNADALQKLSAAHARLFNAWQVLTSTPNPGSRKVKAVARTPLPLVQPLGYSPTNTNEPTS